MRRPLVIIIALAVAAVAGTFLFVPWFPQDPAYDQFADTRPLLGIPNFWNVVSNLPFLAIGVLSLLTIRRNIAASVFGIGLILTAFGSGLYHYAPGNATLLWDRAGMVVAIMAMVALLVESTGEGACPTHHPIAALIVAEAIGIGSLVWWKVNGDLRLYGVVQFFPGLLLIVLPIFFRSRYTRRGILAWVIVFYAVAKGCELYDRQIYDALRFVSGHTLKHLAAAASTLAIWFWLAKRQRNAVETSLPLSGVMSSPARETTT
jgi:hypothetical protein